MEKMQLSSIFFFSPQCRLTAFSLRVVKIVSYKIISDLQYTGWQYPGRVLTSTSLARWSLQQQNIVGQGFLQQWCTSGCYKDSKVKTKIKVKY